MSSSQKAGCFYCLEVFHPSILEEWIDNDGEDEGLTALCPQCGIDSVIGDGDGTEINKPLLNSMRKYWFRNM